MQTPSKKKYIACRISIDGEHWDCSSYRTFEENKKGAWKKMAIDLHGYVPKTKEEFLSRGGKVEGFRSF